MLPIALGHALSIAGVVAVVAMLHAFVDLMILQIGTGVGLVTFGLYRLFARHQGRAGMQIGAGQLVLWSFLMATAHGAGLMLIPVLVGMPSGITYAGHVHSAGITSVGSSTTMALAAVGVHTLAMLVTAGATAVVVYEWVGLAFLRRGWVNFELIWVLALVGAGLIVLADAWW